MPLSGACSSHCHPLAWQLHLRLGPVPSLPAQLGAPAAMEDGMRDAVTLVPCNVRRSLWNSLSRDGAWQQCWNGLCHRAANLSFLQCHPAARARPAADCSWLGTTSHLAGLLLCRPVRAAGSLLRRAGVLTGTNAAPRRLQDPPGLVHAHAPQEVKSPVVPRGELAGAVPAPSPPRCPSWLFALAFMAALFMLRGEHITPCCCCEMQSSETCVCGKTWSFEIGYHWGCNVPVSLH